MKKQTKPQSSVLKLLLVVLILFVYANNKVMAQDVDLEIIKTADATTANEGDIIRYTIKIKNITPISNTATNVVLKDLLP
ncbi:hypothetical protein, partial [Algibacter sp.]|uniref:hypothetical protein n=1 Tax=Algibacter sp. TaxID=1872428 RepID=UPI003C709E59